MDLFDVLSLLGGLCLFLFGMNVMGDALERCRTNHILRKNGHEVQNSDFFKIGIPFTMAAVIPAYILLWLLYGV